MRRTRVPDGARSESVTAPSTGRLDGRPRSRTSKALRLGYPTQGSPVAFARYSDALFTGPVLRGQYPDARIVQAYPEKGLCRTYAPQVYGSTHMRRYAVQLTLSRSRQRSELTRRGLVRATTNSSIRGRIPPDGR